MQVDTLWTNARLATMAAGRAGLGEIARGALAARDGRIAWVGPADELPPGLAARERVDLDGRLVTPGLVDCHTHLVHGGSRAREFELRLAGASYEEIARAGGGIASTVAATRDAGLEALVEGAAPRLATLMAEGVTTVEIKSGYGLDLDTERRMLQAARRLGETRPVRVATTYLGAHAVPPEHRDDADAYVERICREILPELATAGLVDAVDGFCEHIAFSPAQIARVFAAARGLGLPLKLHAEQLSNLGGARLAADWGALSADHLERLDEPGVVAMADAGTVAVMLPGAYYFLRDDTPPPIALLRRHGVPMSVATDMNPGSSPLTSLLLAMNMAATLFRLTVEECLLGTTRIAAQALGLGDAVGTLEPGKACDLAIWDTAEPAELAYRIGFNPLHARIFGGRS